MKGRGGQGVRGEEREKGGEIGALTESYRPQHMEGIVSTTKAVQERVMRDKIKSDKKYPCRACWGSPQCQHPANMPCSQCADTRA